MAKELSKNKYKCPANVFKNVQDLKPQSNENKHYFVILFHPVRIPITKKMKTTDAGVEMGEAEPLIH